MPYLSVRNGDKSAKNKHYEACRLSQEPYVLCLRRLTKADVEFDHISLDSSLDRFFDAHEKQIMDSALEIFHRNAAKGATYDIGAKLMSLRNLPIANAERAAAELFAMLLDVRNRARAA